MTVDEIKNNVSRRAADTLGELDGYYDTDADLIAAIKEGSEKLDDFIHEMADGRVSVYTADRMQWLADNIGRADQEGAVGNGARTAEDIAAFCWYEAEREDIGEDIEEARREIGKMEEREAAS